jgi:hypothetical protein
MHFKVESTCEKYAIVKTPRRGAFRLLLATFGFERRFKSGASNRVELACPGDEVAFRAFFFAPLATGPSAAL